MYNIVCFLIFPTFSSLKFISMIAMFASTNLPFTTKQFTIPTQNDEPQMANAKYYPTVISRVYFSWRLDALDGDGISFGFVDCSAHVAVAISEVLNDGGSEGGTAVQDIYAG